MCAENSPSSLNENYMSHVMRKVFFGICENKRNQPLANFCDYIPVCVGNPEYRFSHIAAHILTSPET